MTIMGNRDAARSGKASKHRFTAILMGAILGTAFVGYASLAEAAWYQGGVLVSNVCRAPSGSWWVYPPYAAQPVGTVCTIASTGELGQVTAN